MTDARRVALDALVRIDTEGAFANLLVPRLLASGDLARRDRAFVTDLVYGTTRMRRACDFLVDRFLLRPVDPPVRAALRLGAYQLHHLGTAPHAAVSATVAVVPGKARGLVNAVLRRVADTPVVWPDDATRLSYPDWIVDQLCTDLGADDALAALTTMNEPATVTTRDDGYVQDRASQWVAELVEARAGDRVLDVCAAPGGKATAMARAAATVVAADVRAARGRLVRDNTRRLHLTNVAVVAAEGRQPPFSPATFDRVLVDAPCSNLGALRRRPDARWRVEAEDVDRLAALQRDLLAAAAPLVRPGGRLVFAVCTLTATETVAVDDWVAKSFPGLRPVPPPSPPWRSHGRGALLLPHAAGTDGMALFRYERTGCAEA